MSSIVHSQGFRQARYSGSRDVAEWIADGVLFVAAAYALRLFSPNLAPVEFATLEVRGWASVTSDGNLSNQIVWVGLAALSSLAVLREPIRLAKFAAPLWPLLALLALCILSAAWSDHPDAAIRRSAQAALIFYCFLVGVAYSTSIDRIVSIFYLIFWGLLLSNLAVAAAPWSFDSVGDFRGTFGHKNGVGAIAAFAVILGFSIIRARLGLMERLLCGLYLVAWGALLVLSGSKTSLALITLVPVAFLLLRAVSEILRLNVGLLLIFGLAMVASFIGLLVYGGGYTPAYIVGLFVGDSSFTGRDAIWEFMLEHIQQSWLFGQGYGSFWGVGFESPNLRSPFSFIRLLNQGHNGYLDLLVSVGAVGLILFMLQLLKAGVQSEAIHYRKPLLFQLVWTAIIFSLIHNITETSLLRGFSPVWIFTMLALLLAARASVEARDRT
jgi:exopolysaccharide production protein ExoQ